MRKSSVRAINTCAALLLGLSLPIVAAPTPKITGTYSSFRFGTEDLTGAEITIVVGGDGYYAIVQCAEGTPGVPQVVRAQVEGLTVTFGLDDAKSGCPVSVFSGTIDMQGLIGAFEGSAWPGLLKRGKSYWQ